MSFRRFLSIFLALALVASLVPATAFPAQAATSGTIENCKWSLNGTVLTITGNGPLYCRSSTSPWGTDITKVIIKSGVTELDFSPFQDCTKLTTVTLPDTVSYIGSNCFKNCSSLTTINLPSGITQIGSCAFYGCSSLTSVSLPRDLKQIFYRAFYDCGLTSVNLPEGLQTIGIEAFYSCSLTSLTVPDSVTQIDRDAFSANRLRSVSIGKGLKTIVTNNLGYGWQTLTVSPENPYLYSQNNCIIRKQDHTLVMGGSATAIPEGVTTIGDFAFNGTDVNLTIPDSVTSIGHHAFFNCDSLTEMVIPDTVTKLGSSVFRGCDNLTSATLGTPITKIPYGTFENCTSLKQVTFKSKVTEFGKYAFSGCTSLETMVVPESVTLLGDFVFEDCTALKDISLPNGIETIPQGAFHNCTSLESIVLPDSVTTIATSAFAACKTLTDISFSKNLAVISNGAFAECLALTEISLPDTVVELYDTSFENTGFYNDATNWDSAALYLGDCLLDYKESVTEAQDYDVREGTRIIAGNAMSSTYYLVNLTIPHSVTHICSRAFAFGYRLANVTFGDGLVSIGVDAFRNCDKLTDVTLGDNVVSIGAEAFYDCDAIKNIRLGSGLTTIGENAFYSLDKLERADIAADNPYFYSSNGILYDAVTGKVVLNPANRVLFLTINYLDSRGNPIANPVNVRRSVRSSYNYTSPEIAFHTPSKAVVSGTLTEDLTVNVIYYEQTIAASGTCGSNISWKLYDDGTLVLKGSGAMPAGVAPWKAHSDAVTALTVDSRITSISAGAFENLPNLAQVDLGYGITTIGDNAFSGCSGLTALTLPDSLTAIGAGSFAGTGLTKLTIPDSVKTIGTGCLENSSLQQIVLGTSVLSVGTNALSGCEALTQVIFRGKPATLETVALGDPEKVLVLYYPGVDGWTTAVVDGLWNGYTAVPRQSVFKDATAEDVLIIKVVDRHNDSLTDAVVTLDGQTQSTNHEGMVYFLRPATPVELQISCSNHLTFTNPTYLPNSSFRVEYVELSDKPSAVWGISCNGSSIATSVATVNCNSDETVRLSVGGYSKYEIAKYELWQDGRLLAWSYTDSGTCTFAVNARSFEDSKTVFVKMYTADGATVSAPLNLRTLRIAEISQAQLIDELSRLQLHLDLEGLGSYDLPLSFQSNGQKVYTQISGSTIRVGLNVDINKLFEQSPDEVTAKTKIHKAIQEHLRSFAKGEADFQYDLAGYLEIECLGGGEYAVRTSYVKVAVGAKLEFNAQASYFGIVGVYFKASLSGTGSLDLLVTGFAPDTGFHVEDANLGLEHVLELEGGAFLLWGAGSAGLYGQLSMGFQLGLVPNVEFESVYISGELGVKWSLFWGLFSGRRKILSGDLYRWPETKHLALNALSGSSIRFNDRSYLENRSPWLSGLTPLSDDTGDALRLNTNYNVNAQVVTAGAATVMVWLEDNENRDDSNYQTLYFSVLDPETGSWSQPRQLDDNDTFDCEFHLYTDGQEIYVLYTEQKDLLSDVDGMDPADPAAIAALIGGVEVAFAQFRDGAFTAPVRLTDNDVCETLPVLFGGEDLQAVWSEAAAMDTAAQSGSGVLYTSRLENGIWSTPAPPALPQRTVSHLAAVSFDGQVYFVYAVDGDGDSATTIDTRLILLSPDGTARQLAQGEISGISAAANRLIWIENGVLWTLDAPEGTPVCLGVSATGTCQLLLLPDGDALICYTAAGKTGTELYALRLSPDNKVSQSVALTATDGNIDRFCVSLRENQLLTVFTRTVITDGESMETSTSLCYIHPSVAPALRIDEVYFDITAIAPGATPELEISVTNIGLAPSEQVTVRFLDSTGTVLFSQDVPLLLESGAAGRLTIAPTLPDGISTQAYTLELTVGTNTVQSPVMLSLSDISLSAEQTLIGGQNHLRLQAVNLGNRPTAAQITVSTADGTVLHQLTTDILSCGQAESYLLDVSTLPGDTLVICQAAEQEADAVAVNDRCVVTLFRATADAIPADPDAVPLNPVLAADSAVYDRSLRTPITILINQGWQDFTGITGLTAKTHYTFSGKIVTLNSNYLYNLPLGEHTLELVFGDGSVRSFALTVMDSAPIYLYGEARIVGTVAVGQTLFADCTGINPTSAKLAYKWEIDNVTVSETDTYTIRPEDQNKGLWLTVTGIDGYKGTYYASVAIPVEAKERPLPPVVMQVSPDSVTLVTISGLQYSADGTQWQDNGKFSGLNPNTTYTFYARNAAGVTSQEVRVTTLKFSAEAAPRPVVAAVTADSVTLEAVPGCLYSMDGTLWQADNRFTGLSPNTGYTFYQKYAETDTHYAGPAGEGVSVTTHKRTPDAPAAPIVSTRSDTTVSLRFMEGYEYSMDGVHWQNIYSGLWHSPSSFTGLTPNTTYSFYQRIAETEDAYASPASEPLVIRTWKRSIGKAPTPVIESVTTHSITVAFTEGMEYKIEVYGGFITKEEIYTGIWGTAEEPVRDNTGWQTSNVFTDLVPSTIYVVYQRYAATEDSYAGADGDGLQVATAALTPISGQLQIIGLPCVGQTLTAELTEFNGDMEQLKYQWYADGEPIVGAISDSYTVAFEDAGKQLTLQLTGIGSWTGTLEATAERTTYLPGDVNGDNKVNMRDWSMLYNHICETGLLPEESHLGADVNNDGKINMKDWLRLYSHISEINPLW